MGRGGEKVMLCSYSKHTLNESHLRQDIAFHIPGSHCFIASGPRFFDRLGLTLADPVSYCKAVRGRQNIGVNDGQGACKYLRKLDDVPRG